MCVILLASCSGGKDDGPSDDGSVGPKPGSTPAQALRPLRPPPGFSEIKGRGFTLFAPAPFTPEQRTSSNGEPLLRLNTPGGGDNQFVAVVRDMNPRADASDQSTVLEGNRRDVDRATDVSREEIEWPGARRAFLVAWTVQKRLTASDSSTVSVRTVQLITQVDDNLILAVLAVSPLESFDQSQVGNVLRTFRPGPG